MFDPSASCQIHSRSLIVHPQENQVREVLVAGMLSLTSFTNRTEDNGEPNGATNREGDTMR
jgi:hypothetical protein